MLHITQKAHEWFKKEMGIGNGKGVRFLSKVYGCSPIHDNFSLAIEAMEPTNPISLQVIDNIPYFIESGDEWFFEGYQLVVEYNATLDEPEYHYKEKKSD